MPRMEILFLGYEQIEQHFGTGDDYAVLRVHFSLHPPDRPVIADCYADVKQVVGADFNSAGALEVSPPKRKDGAELPQVGGYNALRAEIEKYCQGLVGPNGAAIAFGPGAGAVMNANFISFPWTTDVEVPAPTPGGMW